MRQCAMPEKQVGQPVQILHLHIGASQNVGLFVVLDESDGNVRLFDSHFVRLLGDDTDHISQFALHGELSDCSHHEFPLQRRH